MSQSDQPLANTGPAPIIGPGHTYATITDKIAAITLSRTPAFWVAGFGLSFMMVMVLMYSLTVLVLRGIGIWGENVPVGWASILSTSSGGSGSATPEP